MPLHEPSHVPNTSTRTYRRSHATVHHISTKARDATGHRVRNGRTADPGCFRLYRHSPTLPLLDHARLYVRPGDDESLLLFRSECTSSPIIRTTHSPARSK